MPYGNRNCWDCPHCEQYNGFQEVQAPLLPGGGHGPKALGWQCHTTTSGGSGFTPRSFWFRSPFPALRQTRSRQALCRGRVAALWAMLCCDRPALSSHRRRHGHKRAWAPVRRNSRRPRRPAHGLHSSSPVWQGARGYGVGGRLHARGSTGSFFGREASVAPCKERGHLRSATFSLECRQMGPPS